MSTPRLAAPNDMKVLWAADDAGLSQAQHRLLCRIYRRYNRRDGCFEGLPEMARACKMSLNTAREAKKALVARGLVIETERPGLTSRLDVTDPETWVPLPKGGRGTPTKRTPTKSGTPPVSGEGSPTNPGEGYPYQMRVDEVNTGSEPTSEPNTLSRARARGGWQVEMLREAFPDYSPTIYQQDLIRAKVTEREPWQAALDFWRGNDYRPGSITKLLARYTEEVHERTKPQPANGTGKRDARAHRGSPAPLPTAGRSGNLDGLVAGRKGEA